MGDNILLINPAINSSSQSKIVNAVINTTFPTSLGTLAAYVASRGLGRARIIDEQLDFIEDADLPAVIGAIGSPRIVGLSVLTINSKRAYELAKKIKKIDPGCTVLAGGIHPTVLPDEALRSGIDIVVRGEGERTLEELSRSIISGSDPYKAAGISYVSEGKTIHNPARPPIDDLDEIPPFPYEYFEKDRLRYPSFGGIFTSRGCPYDCIFCSSRSISGKKYRYFSVARVVSEIKLLVEKYGQRTIWLMDDNIAGNRRRFQELLDAIAAAGLPASVAFHGSMRADNITEEILDKAKAANFKMLAFGMETGSETLMTLIDKGETVRQVVDAVEMTDRKGIAAATTIIFGLPGETSKDRWEAMRLVDKMPLSSVRFNTLTPYPGTPVYEMLKDRGEVVRKADWENFAVQYMWEGDELPYVPKGNSRYQLMFDTMFANLSFYLSPNGIRRMLRSSFAGGNVINMSDRWYLSPAKIWRMARLVLFLVTRFLYVSIRALADRMAPADHKGFDHIKEDLDSLSSRYENAGPSSSGAVAGIYDAYSAKVMENVIYEKYVDIKRPLYTRLPFNYQRLPAAIRYYGQRLLRTDGACDRSFPAWPFEGSLERLRKASKGRLPAASCAFSKALSWPGSKRSVVVLTHDIESDTNWTWVRRIAEVEMDLGFRSCWNVVPRLYRIDHDTLKWLKENGFEIGLHGYNHDNKLVFLAEAAIRRRIESAGPFMREYNIRGFRSPSWLRNAKLFGVLKDYFLYDMSALDVDRISPGGVGGSCSLFPYSVNGLVEVPTTIPYEYPLQRGVAADGLNDFWKGKISMIKEIGGAIAVITHPDPYYGGSDVLVDAYRKLLESFAADSGLARMLPREAAEHYIAETFTASREVRQ